MVAYIFFFYTLLLFGLCVLAASVCLSSYMASRRSLFLAATTFLCLYAVELSFIFIEEYTRTKITLDLDQVDMVLTIPAARLAVSVLLIGSAWWFILAFLDKFTLQRWIIPIIILFVVQTGALLPADNNMKQLLFYTSRNLALVGFALYALWEYRHSIGSFKYYLKRFAPIATILAVLLAATIALDLITAANFGPLFSDSTEIVYYLFGRNLFENVLVIVLACCALKASCATLLIRFTQPPALGSQSVTSRTETQVLRFCEKFELTEREREILQLVLQDKSNQNIATELQLAPGTIKTHIHNIYVKTNCKTREDIKRAFWAQ